MIRLLGAACLFIVLMSFGGRPALAAESARHPVVRVTVAGASKTTTDLLIARLARTWEQLDATIITVVTPGMTLGDVLTPNAPGDRARVWIDLRDPDAATIFVAEAGNVFERRISFEQGFDDVALELLDVVATSAVQAVLAGGHLGVPRAKFNHSAAAPATPKSADSAPVEADARASRVRLLAGLTYQGTLLGSSAFAHGPGLEAQLQWPKVRLELELRGRFPFRVDSDGQSLSLAPEGVRLGVGRAFEIGPRVACVLSLTGGIDVTRVRLSSPDPNLAASAAFWSVSPVVSPVVRVEYLLGDLRAALRVGVDLDFWNTSYVVSTARGASPVWAPWRARPVAGAALSYAF